MSELDYYEQYGYEPSEVEEAFQDFLKKVGESAKQSVKDLIAQNGKDKQANQDYQKELEEQRYKLVERETAVVNKEKDFENNKASYFIKFLSSYGLDLTIGQKVFVLQYVRDDNTNCPDCKGGKITKFIDGVDYFTKCTKCDGRGYFIHQHYEIKSGIVVSVKVSFNLYKKDQTIYEDKNLGFEKDMATVEVDFGGYRDSYWYKRADIYLDEESAKKAIEQKESGSK